MNTPTSQNQFNSEIMAVLWDMDGILIDTTQYHFIAWQQVLSEHNISLEWEAFKSVFGLANVLIMEKFLGKENDPAFLNDVEVRKETLFRQAIHGHVSLLPGVRTWLENFKALNYRQAVASSAPSENVELLLQATGIRPFFSAMVSADGMPSKPNPAIFLRAAELLQVPTEHCVVIEDASHGVEAALKAGMKCIAVANNLSPEELFRANLVVSSLENLTMEAFSKLN